MQPTKDTQLTLFVADSPARMSPLPESGRGWMESGADSGGSLLELLTNLNRNGLSLRMSPVYYPPADVPLVEPLEELCESMPTSAVNEKSISRALSALPLKECLSLIKAATLPKSFTGWSNAGMASHGGYLTLNISEFPNDAVACSLSDILEMDVPRKYYLSPKAARGILRRADKRGKTLPIHLEQTLRTLATREMGE